MRIELMLEEEKTLIQRLELSKKNMQFGAISDIFSAKKSDEIVWL